MPRACSNKAICAYVKSMTRIWPTRRTFRRGLPPARRLTPSMGSYSLSLKALTTTDRRIRLVKIPDGKSTSIRAKEEEEELVQDLK